MATAIPKPDKGLVPRRDLSAPAPDQSRKQEMEAMQRRLSERRKPEKNPSATRADVLD